MPDVALVHAHRADRAGNIALDPTIRWPDAGIMPKAARKVIVTVEEIVDTDVLRRNPDRTRAARLHRGCRRRGALRRPPDLLLSALHLRHRGCTWTGRRPRATTAGAADFLERYVVEPADQVEYLDAAGGATTLLALVEAVRG